MQTNGPIWHVQLAQALPLLLLLLVGFELPLLVNTKQPLHSDDGQTTLPPLPEPDEPRPEPPGAGVVQKLWNEFQAGEGDEKSVLRMGFRSSKKHKFTWPTNCGQPPKNTKLIDKILKEEYALLEFPNFFSSVVTIFGEEGMGLCVGTILNREFVVTTQSCLEKISSVQGPLVIRIMAGDTTRDPEKFSGKVLFLSPADCYPSSYNNITGIMGQNLNINDVALIEIDGELVLDQNTSWACMASKNTDAPIEIDENSKCFLVKVTKTKHEAYRVKAKTCWQGQKHSSNFCVRSYSTKNVPSMCSKDNSGSPVFCLVDNKITLMGQISIPEKGACHPNVFTVVNMTHIAKLGSLDACGKFVLY